MLSEMDSWICFEGEVQHHEESLLAKIGMDNLGKQKNFCCFWAENLDFAFFICGLTFKNGSIDEN